MNFAKLTAFVRTLQQNKNKAITHRFRLINLKTNQIFHCNFLQYSSIVLFPQMNWKLLIWSSPLELLLKSPSSEVSHCVVEFLFAVERVNKTRPFKICRQTDPSIWLETVKASHVQVKQYSAFLGNILVHSKNLTVVISNLILTWKKGTCGEELPKTTSPANFTSSIHHLCALSICQQNFVQ